MNIFNSGNYGPVDCYERQLKSQKPQNRISQKVGSMAEKGYGNHKSELESLYPFPKKCLLVDSHAI